MSRKVIVIGDSVLWGQGLTEPQKIHKCVAAALNIPSADIVSTAHSGAIIGAKNSTTKKSLYGEVPTSYPTIFQQCSSVANKYPDVALVLLNGGINDIDFRFIINPFTDQEDLSDAIEMYCYHDLKLLIERVAQIFSDLQTRIVLTGYYPILSKESNVDLIPQFMAVHGLSLPSLLPLPKFLIFDRMVANCQRFWKESNQWFTRAVREVNETLGGVPRILFSQVLFQDENAALGPNPWLWGIQPDLTAEDPMRDVRHDACNLYEPDLIQRQVCFRASAGHPNILGAKHFAQSILNVWRLATKM
jgi:hypothetical protein